MKKIKVLTLMGIFLVSAMIFSIPPTVAVAPEAAADTNEEFLLVGTTNLGYDLDPQFSWDSASSDINNQIWEGLFAYDLGDPSLRVIPVLAEKCGVWSDDGLYFNVTLRENVTYSNGDEFNASCVVDSFDRLRDLCVFEEDQVAELYFPFGVNATDENDDDYPNHGYIINETIDVNATYVSFKLNYKYVPFEALLCFSASFIMHPNAPTHESDPGNAYLDYANVTNAPEIVVGTGPYTLEEHTLEEVVFEFNPTYHRGEPAILRFKYMKYLNSDTISVALLDETLDYGGWSADFLQDMRDAEHMIVGAKRPNTIISYLGYNNHLISQDMRIAMNMAIDYDYIIDEIINGQATRMTSIVPPGILYHIDCDVPVLDLAASRKYLIDHITYRDKSFTDNWGLDETSLDEDWIEVAEGTNPVASYSYTYNLGNIAREDIGIALISDFAKIGIRVNMAGVTWGQFLSKLYTAPDQLDLFRVGWMPDYNDPSNYINPLMSNTSAGNGAQVNDDYAQNLMDNGTRETDPAKRQEIYEKLQTYLAEDLQPWAFLFTGFGQNAVNEHITIQRNAMGYQYLFPWGWNGINTTWNDGYDNDVYCTPINDNIPEDFWPEIKKTIPGYTMFVLLGVVAATIVAIIKKRK